MQVLYGSVVGTVVDETGSAVPGAKVRITSMNTQQVRETETDASGTYSFPSLTGDIYDIVVSRNGFQTFNARACQSRLTPHTRRCDTQSRAD